jgi:hypothetical protein
VLRTRNLRQLRPARRRRRPWLRSFRKPGSAACRPGAWTIWCRRWGWGASARAR